MSRVESIQHIIQQEKRKHKTQNTYAHFTISAEKFFLVRIHSANH